MQQPKSSKLCILMYLLNKRVLNYCNKQESGKRNYRHNWNIRIWISTKYSVHMHLQVWLDTSKSNFLMIWLNIRHISAGYIVFINSSCNRCRLWSFSNIFCSWYNNNWAISTSQKYKYCMSSKIVCKEEG